MRRRLFIWILRNSAVEKFEVGYDAKTKITFRPTTITSKGTLEFRRLGADLGVIAGIIGVLGCAIPLVINSRDTSNVIAGSSYDDLFATLLALAYPNILCNNKGQAQGEDFLPNLLSSQSTVDGKDDWHRCDILSLPKRIVELGIRLANCA